ncbi:hypothetical protein [Hydrogenophaga sp.]|uniref:phage major capsid protein n=1 Tax=Hydrogenophaga sp. TaxID=1904254 RepID=UPI002720C156|nr:hypothetical protein [Hydrogenophaga sp.]MDO9438555.1 hypothetical protein [Hydrogenophaga sp.]
MNLEINPREILAAAPDGLAMQMGVAVKSPHPFADQVSLSSLAHACGRLAPTYRAASHDVAIMGAGMGTTDFSRQLANAAQHLVTRTFSAQAQHSAFCIPLDVRDFSPIDLPGLDTEMALEAIGQLGEIQWGLVSTIAGASQVRLATFAKAFGLSRQMIINDQHSSFARMFESLGASGARTEAKLVAAALEGNQVLDDGEETFDVLFGNVLAEALSGAALGTAMGKLRTQVLPNGQLSDLAARHLVVSGELEYTARQLVIDAGVDVEVHALAYLTAGRWFLLADPKIQPTVATLRLNGSAQSVRVEQARRPTHFDGSAVKATTDLGATLLGRFGIVRGGV